MDILGLIDPAKIFDLIPEFIKAILPFAPAVLGKIYSIIFTVSAVVSVLLVYFIIYSKYGQIQVNKKISELLSPPDIEEAYAENIPSAPDNILPRWRKILGFSDSENQNDWIMAIIEADKILEELLEVNGYVGDGVGEMLKAVNPGDMQNLDDAWTAHKVRNSIAHEPNFTLSKYEAKKTIDQYRKVFQEYGII